MFCRVLLNVITRGDWFVLVMSGLDVSNDFFFPLWIVFQTVYQGNYLYNLVS